MKKIISLIIIGIMLMSLSSCSTKVKKSDETFFDQFIAVEERSNINDGSCYIVYDKDTLVMYYYIEDGHQLALCPIYNADGTIKVYEKE